MVRIIDLEKESTVDEETTKSPERVPTPSHNAGPPVVTSLQIVSSTNLPISPVPLSWDNSLVTARRQQLQTPLPPRTTTPLSHIHILDSPGRSNLDHVASSSPSLRLFGKDLMGPPPKTLVTNTPLPPRTTTPLGHIHILDSPGRSNLDHAASYSSSHGLFRKDLSCQNLLAPRQRSFQENAPALAVKKRKFETNQELTLPVTLNKDDPLPLGLRNSLLNLPNSVLSLPESEIMLLKYGPPPLGLKNSLLDPANTVLPPPDIMLRSPPPLGLRNSLLDPPDTVLSRPGITLSRSGPLSNSVLDSTMGQNVDMSVRNIHLSASASAAATVPPRPPKTPSIDPPFEWASNTRCKVNNLETLTFDKIWLQVKCMECRNSYKVWLDLRTRLKNIVDFMRTSRSYEVPIPSLTEMPRQCRECHKISILEPVHAKKKRNLNWIGLLLAHELGSLSYDQLVYYCRHRGLPWHKCIKPQLVRMCLRDLIHQLGLTPNPPPP